ncbi:MAG TPA: NfeD family protein, partial [Gemmataceae bacterium]|nr:NfeD family protein [Gemmataceae bacterium]
LKGRPAEELKEIGTGIEDLAKRRSYPPVLARGFVDPSVERLYYVTRRNRSHEWAIVTGRDLDADRNLAPNERRWNRYGPGDAIPLGSDGFLTLNAAQAQRFGLAHPRAQDLASLYEDFGVKQSQVQIAGADWLDDLAEFLKNDWTSFLLIMVGITCLILELKLPGVGLPGVIAALCFVLYFWSHAQWAGGQVTWLAILLFVLGLVLLGIEIFVLPGFGVCGISGIILVIGSLALVAYGHWPQSGREWVDLSKQVGPLGLVLMGSVVLAVLLARYLPNIPYANRLLLKPQTETEGIDEAVEAVQSAHAALLGAIGVSATPLRPAGKVQFGDQFVDVVAEGSYIAPGSRVQVIEIEGNRVVVKQV